MALVGLTAAALIGGVMAADPADAGKKKKKKNKARHAKVVQISKGGNAKAGNGGNGGAGGSSGNVHNTGNVGGGTPATGPGAGLLPRQAACATLAFLTLDAATPNTPGIPGPIDAADITAALVGGTPQCFPSFGAIPAPFVACIIAAGGDALLQAEAADCLNVTPGTPDGGGTVFSGSGGAGGSGGDGGDATGGTAGNNTNTNSVIVSSDDHSIDVNS
jgi:hypothetical protein